MKIFTGLHRALLLRISFVLILFIFISTAKAQVDYGYEFGTIDTAWIKRQVYEPDTTAEAVILYSYGKCTAEPYRGTKLMIQRAIKILKKDGVDNWGSLEIEAPDSKLIKFSAVVYNFENGRITSQSLTYDDIFKEKEKGKTVTKVPFPNVQPGSVIELSYTLKSNGYGIYSWEFQHYIPVRYSEYEVYFPGSMFGSTAIINGSYFLLINAKEKGKSKTYKLFDIPAFKKEPFMPPVNWYRSSIEFRSGLGNAEIYRLKLIEEHGMLRDSSKMDTKTLAQANFSIDPKGLLVGTLDLKWSGYGASLARKEIRESGNEDFLKGAYTSKQWNVEKQVLENTDSSSLDLIARYQVEIPDNIQVTDSLLYINPFLALKEEQNPFKLEKRLYPVDLVSRTEKTMIAQLTIPEGYVVDELPESGILALPNKAGTFISSVTHQGNKIYITSKIKFNKIVFNLPEYPALREFYLQIVAKKSRLIVLRKIKM